MPLQNNQLPTWARFLGVTVTVTILFLVYLFTIGIPKTQARNYYNQALVAKLNNQSELVEPLLTKAYVAWPEAYIQKFLQTAID